MPTLILSPRNSPDSIVLWRQAIKLGWDVERLSWRVPGDFNPEEPVIYGEPLFATTVAEMMGTTLVGPTFNWLHDLDEDYLSRKVSISTLQKAKSMSRPTFIKSAMGDMKYFPAGVYKPGQEIPGCELLEPEFPILVSDPVEWEVEFRTFVRDRKVLTSSVYIRNGELAVTPDEQWQCSREESEQALAFCKYLLSDTQALMPPAFVLDVGRIKGRGWAVVEANHAYGSGLCGCDPEAVLEVLRGTCIKNPTEDDLFWARMPK